MGKGGLSLKSLKPVLADADLIRAGQYPRIGDQLDAIMKLAAHLRSQGIELPAEVDSWVDACLEVKRRIPQSKTKNNPPA
jgi:hypothetical protein